MFFKWQEISQSDCATHTLTQNVLLSRIVESQILMLWPGYFICHSGDKALSLPYNILPYARARSSDQNKTQSVYFDNSDSRSRNAISNDFKINSLHFVIDNVNYISFSLNLFHHASKSVCGARPNDNQMKTSDQCTTTKTNTKTQNIVRSVFIDRTFAIYI